MNNKPYIGRFAPSPTGPLHYGTMIAAIASFLQARAHQGRWLVRIEDVDAVRCIKGADTQILKTLEAFALHWDGEVVYQSTRTDLYEQALAQLKQKQIIYPCSCSRKQIAEKTGEYSPVYPGTCRASTNWSGDDYAVRLKISDTMIEFNDVIYGEQQQALAEDVGDFVIKRRDGLFAYQLAVVVDDAEQSVTEVVRGADLLDSTARQIYLQQCLGLPTPKYFHLPLVLDAAGKKLSKSSGATALNDTKPIPTILSILQFLGQSAPTDASSLDTIWQHAIAHWQPERIPQIHKQL